MICKYNGFIRETGGWMCQTYTTLTFFMIVCANNGYTGGRNAMYVTNEQINKWTNEQMNKMGGITEIWGGDIYIWITLK